MPTTVQRHPTGCCGAELRAFSMLSCWRRASAARQAGMCACGTIPAPQRAVTVCLPVPRLSQARSVPVYVRLQAPRGEPGLAYHSRGSRDTALCSASHRATRTGRQLTARRPCCSTSRDHGCQRSSTSHVVRPQDPQAGPASAQGEASIQTSSGRSRGAGHEHALLLGCPMDKVMQRSLPADALQVRAPFLSVSVPA